MRNAVSSFEFQVWAKPVFQVIAECQHHSSRNQSVMGLAETRNLKLETPFYLMALPKPETRNLKLVPTNLDSH